MKTTNEEIKGLRFKVQFAETNLLWLAGEPDGDETRRLREFNRGVIRDAQTQIEQLNQGAE